MTRREKMLLQILVVIGLVGMSIIYLLMPAVRDKKAFQDELEDMQLQELQMRAVLQTPDVEETLQRQQELAEENYEYFYSKLNSYTVDSILNNLVAESGLEMIGMSIGNYSPIQVDTLYRGQTETAGEMAADGQTADGQEEFLLGCSVNLTVAGSYRQILELTDVLKQESTCIEVTTLNLTQEQRIVDVEEPVEASLSLLIYGISKTVGEDV